MMEPGWIARPAALQVVLIPFWEGEQEAAFYVTVYIVMGHLKCFAELGRW